MGNIQEFAGGLAMTPEFELTMLAFAFFDTLMLILILKALTHIRAFNKALHDILLERQLEKEIRSHLHVKLQSPIRIWKEQEKPAVSTSTQPLPAKIKEKKVIEAGLTAPKTAKKAITKTVALCAPNMHKWVMDKEKNYYCGKCGKRF